MVRKAIENAERQVRYLDRVTIGELERVEFNEFHFRHTMHSEKAVERQRARMAAAAFVGWQLGAGEKGQSLNNYLKRMGLLERDEEMAEEEKKQVIAQANHADAVCRQWFKKNVRAKSG